MTDDLPAAGTALTLQLNISALNALQVLAREDDNCAQVGSSRDWERLRQTINEHGTIMQRQVGQGLHFELGLHDLIGVNARHRF